MAIQHIATILCEYLIRSDVGKMSACGVFRNILAPDFPVSRKACVFVEISGAHGDPFRVSLEGNGIDVTVIEGVID